MSSNISKISWRLAPARPEDEAAVLALYRSLLGTPGTTWNEYYPGPEEVTADTARGSLWCAWGEDGSLLAAASLGDDDSDIRDLSCWAPAAKSCELSRVGVRRDLHGQGMGEAFTRRLLEEAKAQGRETARLLVSRDNPAAARLYQKLGFQTCGETRMYQVNWLCQELPLK